MENGNSPIFQMAELDQDLHVLRRRLAQFPKAIAEARRQLDAEQVLLEELETPWNELAHQVREKEATIAVALDTIAKFEAHMEKVTTQKEYMAARKQVDDARRLNTQLQEEILQAQVKQEEIKPQLDQVRERYNAVLGGFQEQEAAILKEQAGVVKEATKRETKIKKLAEKIGDREWSYYQRLAKGRKTPAIVRVEGGTCSGCQMTIPPQSYNLLIANPEQFHTCAHCSRIIYYLPPEPEEIAQPEPAPEKPPRAAKRAKTTTPSAQPVEGAAPPV